MTSVINHKFVQLYTIQHTLTSKPAPQKRRLFCSSSQCSSFWVSGVVIVCQHHTTLYTVLFTIYNCKWMHIRSSLHNASYSTITTIISLY